MKTKYEGIANYSSNFNVNISRPLDTRQVIESLDLLTKPKSTFGGYAYNGMVVSVPEEGLFVLNNYDESKADSTEYNATSSIDDAILKNYGWNRLLTTEVEDNTFISNLNLSALTHTRYNSGTSGYYIENKSSVPRTTIGITNKNLDNSNKTIGLSQILLHHKRISIDILNKDTEDTDYSVFHIALGTKSEHQYDNTLFKITHNPVTSISKATGSTIANANTETLDDDLLVSVGYLNKKLEEFVPKTQSSISMYITDIDGSGNEKPTDSIAQVRVIRENGIVTFEVDDTQVLSGVSSSNNVLDNLQLNITNKNSDGSLSPTEDIATVSVIRNIKTGKMSIRIS